MIKGAQKQMIVMRIGDSRYFEEAYFVLRREMGCGGPLRDEMVREANRILEESGMDLTRRKKRTSRAVLLFVVGLLLGGGVALLLCRLLR